MFYINLKYWQKSVCFKLLQGMWAANFLFLWSNISGITSTLFFPSKTNTSQNILQLQKVEQISSKWSFTKCALIGGKKRCYLSGILLIDVIISSFWQCFEGSSIYGTESYKRKIYNISPRSVGKKTKCIETQQSFKTKKENSS